uniref:Uncharacterized protein n=1 Tax=Anguilla anguilla TaxID=7936 RepID=A0A0E9WGA0_ANGAN
MKRCIYSVDYIDVRISRVMQKASVGKKRGNSEGDH